LPSGAGWPACDGDACECGPSASPGAGLGAVLADRAARQRATRSSALTSRTWMGGPVGNKPPLTSSSPWDAERGGAG
jgi:hypothetical protein